MKKIDKLVLGAFLGPFVITFLVVVFILLNIQMLKYFDDIIGKGLGWDVVAQLFFYFGVFTTPTALPLAVLLSALIAYGNLGEHFELTAIKGSGISLLRTLLPIFVFVVILTGFAFYVNNNLVPKAALEAYSLLYDIKQKKPALDLREGSFYGGIPNISIKVNKKFEDGETLKDIIIYDHRKNDGNKDVIVADSGRMYTILNEQYLNFELFNGYNYTEGSNAQDVGKKKAGKGGSITYNRTSFSNSQMVFDLSSFKLERTDKRWFQSNRIMRNVSELDQDIDSMGSVVKNWQLEYYTNKRTPFTYFMHDDSVTMPLSLYEYKIRKDSMNEAERKNRQSTLEKQPSSDAVTRKPSVAERSVTPNKVEPSKSEFSSRYKERLEKRKKEAEKRKQLRKKKIKKENKALKNKKGQVVQKKLEPDQKLKKDTLSPEQRRALTKARLDSTFAAKPSLESIRNAAGVARQVKSRIEAAQQEMENSIKELRVFEIQWHKIIANSMACIAMFLIGAPLGAIIKRGGLGVPFLVSILFFIIYYLLTMQGEKLAKQSTISVVLGVWIADIILLFIGLFFLKQAKNDARLFESDFYAVTAYKFGNWLKKRKLAKTTAP